MTTQEVALRPITPRQREIFRWIREYHAHERMGPSVRDVMKQFKIASPNGVVCHIRALVAKGWLQRRPMIARSFIPTLEALNHEDA